MLKLKLKYYYASTVVKNMFSRFKLGHAANYVMSTMDNNLEILDRMTGTP